MKISWCNKRKINIKLDVLTRCCQTKVVHVLKILLLPNFLSAKVMKCPQLDPNFFCYSNLLICPFQKECMALFSFLCPTDDVL